MTSINTSRGSGLGEKINSVGIGGRREIVVNNLISSHIIYFNNDERYRRWRV